MLKRVLERAKRLRYVEIALKVNSRYGADGGGHLAASMTYYGFLSLFPLILVALSIIGFLLATDARAQAEWASRLSSSVPGLGPMIGRNIGALVHRRGSAGALGLIGLAWSGTALTNAAGYAIARVDRTKEARGFVKQKLWSISATIGLGILALAGVGVAGLFAGIRAHGWAGVVLGTAAVLVAFVLDVVLFITAYRVLGSAQRSPLRGLLPGAVLAATGWTALKFAGAWYASRTVAHASQVYGTFGTVVGALALLYMASRLFLYGAELNAVLFCSTGHQTPTADAPGSP